MPKCKKTAYIIEDERHKYMYGAFPFNKKGLKNAKRFIGELETKNHAKFVLKTK